MSDANEYDVDYEYNDNEKLEIIMINLMKMIKARGLIEKADKDTTKMLLNSVKNNNYGMIKLDREDRFGNTEYEVEVINDNIINLSKGSVISNSIRTKKHKIIIVDDITPRQRQILFENYMNIEVFKKMELMINLIDHVYIPTHILLTEEEKETFFKEYNVTKNEMHKMLTTDPVCRYYNGQRNDIFKIIRTSTNNGYSINYRIVIKGSFSD